MKIRIRTRNLLLTPETHDEIRQRLHSALGRISPRILAVDVTITDINGPRGGADKQCRMRIHGEELASVVIEHVGEDTLATVSLVAGRAQQAVLRNVARRRAFAPILAH